MTLKMHICYERKVYASWVVMSDNSIASINCISSNFLFNIAYHNTALAKKTFIVNQFNQYQITKSSTTLKKWDEVPD